MAEIAIVKVRTPQDLEWNPSGSLKKILTSMGLGGFVSRLEHAEGKPFMPQLALPLLAGLGERYNQAKGTHHHFHLFDDREDRLDLSGFDMVWFTTGTNGADATYRVSDRVRRRGIPTVIGGIHATMMAREVSAHATSVARGEAEGLVFQILEDFDGGGLQPEYYGVRAQSLAGQPIPRWQDADGDYPAWLVPVETSRGCMNACRFCSTTRFQGARRRHRPVEDVVAEIRFLQETGVLTDDKTVFFTDNNIVWDADYRHGVTDKTYSRRLFEALIPLGINWVGQGEVGVGADPDLVALMSASGCHTLLVGLETLEQKALAGLGKPCNDVSFYRDAISVLRDHGIANIGCFVLGLDEDGPEVFDQVRGFVEKWVDIPQISILTPFPGTALFRQYEREDRLLHRDWSQYDITNVVYRPAKMTPEELDRGYLSLTKDLYGYADAMSRAMRYALRPTVNGMPRFGTLDRFTSVLAPNIVYRWLSRASRVGSLVPSRWERFKDRLWTSTDWGASGGGELAYR